MVETNEERELLRHILNRLFLVGRAGVSHQDLRPNDSDIELQILESLTSLYQKISTAGFGQR